MVEAARWSNGSLLTCSGLESQMGVDKLCSSNSNNRSKLRACKLGILAGSSILLCVCVYVCVCVCVRAC